MNEALCNLCHLSLLAGDIPHICPECHSPSHDECWQENGGCGTYGCSHAPELSKQASPETLTYWGQESKICPACSQEIKAAALKCRFCGVGFQTSVPMTREDYLAIHEKSSKREESKVWGIALFIGGIVPIFSPIALIGGLWLWVFRRTELKQLPPLYYLLARLGLGVAAVWMLLAIGVFLSSIGGDG